MAKPATLRRRAQRQRAKTRALRQPSPMDQMLRSIYTPAIIEQFQKDLLIRRMWEREEASFHGEYYTTIPISLRPSRT